MRFAYLLCAFLLAFGSWVPFLISPQEADAETAGETLTVRVQYFGERGDKIREKASFTRDDLEALGAQTWCYSNVTRVGTVMSMRARGPEVLAILDASGIAIGSIKNITFRTTDGYTRNFTVQTHLSGGRYFYPELSSNYERSEDGDSLTPLDGALAGAEEVPAILALEFGKSNDEFARAEEQSMSRNQCYRFCMGQTPLQEGVQTRPGFEGGDVSSMDSVHSIYGIDVTLEGSPVEMGIDPVDTDLKVGSVTKLTINLSAVDEEILQEYQETMGKLTWTSSDPSIATVDQEGNVTILKEGKVTITVTSENGLEKSITLNGTSDSTNQGGAVSPGASADPQDQAGGETEQENDDSDAQSDEDPEDAAAQKKESRKDTETRKSTSKPADTTKATEKKKVRVSELQLGNRIEPEPKGSSEQHAMTQDTAALEETESYGKGTAAGAAGTAALACGAGAIHRFRRYRSILRGWKR